MGEKQLNASAGASSGDCTHFHTQFIWVGGQNLWLRGLHDTPQKDWKREVKTNYT